MTDTNSNNSVVAGTSNIVSLADARKHKKRKAVEKEAEILLRISREIDAVLVRHLKLGDVDPRELAGLLSHRLGTLMRHMESKEVLWDVCEKVLKKQAHLDKKA